MNFKEEVRNYLRIEGTINEMKADTRRKMAGALAALSIGATGLHAQDVDKRSVNEWQTISYLQKVDNFPMPKTKLEAWNDYNKCEKAAREFCTKTDELSEWYDQFVSRVLKGKIGTPSYHDLNDAKEAEKLMDEYLASEEFKEEKDEEKIELAKLLLYYISLLGKE